MQEKKKKSHDAQNVKNAAISHSKFPPFTARPLVGGGLYHIALRRREHSLKGIPAALKLFTLKVAEAAAEENAACRAAPNPQPNGQVSICAGDFKCSKWVNG